MVLNKEFDIPSTNEILKVAVNRGTWKSKTPLQKWSYFYGIGRLLVCPLKLTTYQEDQTLSWFSYYSLFYCGLHAICVVCTGIHYILLGEPKNFLPCTCMFVGPVCGILPVAVMVVSNERYLLHDFLTFPGQSIYPNDVDDEDYEYYNICSKSIDATIKRFLWKMAIICCSVSAALIYPVYQFLRYGIISTILELKFPYIDDQSNVEYLLNGFILANIVGHGFFGYIGIEVGVDIETDFILVSSKLLEYRLKKLDNHDKSENANDSDISLMLGIIVHHLHGFEKFLDCLNELFYWRSLIVPLVYNYAIGMSIYCQFNMGFSSGYGFATMLWVQWYFVCELGECDDNHGMSDIFYESYWYKLPIKYQQDIKCLIHATQNGTKLSVGPFDTINREYFTKITQKIYSFVMFLINFGSNKN